VAVGTHARENSSRILENDRTNERNGGVFLTVAHGLRTLTARLCALQLCVVSPHATRRYQCDVTLLCAITSCTVRLARSVKFTYNAVG